MYIPFEQIGTVVVITFVLGVAYLDLSTHRIPNALCACGALIGLALQIWMHGFAGLQPALGGFAVGLGMFLPFYIWRGFGAGDVKAMGTIGVFLGPKLTFLAAGLTLIAGAALALLLLARRKKTFSSAVYGVIGVVMAFRSVAFANSSSSMTEQQRFPYGAAIAAGTLVSLLWSGRLATLLGGL